MNIDFTNEQFRELLVDVALGSYIRMSRCDEDDDAGVERIGELESYLLTFTDKFGASDMAEEDEDGDLILSEETMEYIIQDVLADFVEDHFWEQLTARLAQRDFLRDTSKKEVEKMMQSDTPPKQLEAAFKKYLAEFDKHGTDRLEIARK